VKEKGGKLKCMKSICAALFVENINSMTPMRVLGSVHPATGRATPKR
jgi:hypothetical protein